MTDGDLAVIGPGSAGSIALWQAAGLASGVVGFEARTPGHGSLIARRALGHPTDLDLQDTLRFAGPGRFPSTMAR